MTYKCLLCGVDHPIVNGRVHHTVFDGDALETSAPDMSDGVEPWTCEASCVGGGYPALCYMYPDERHEGCPRNRHRCAATNRDGYQCELSAGHRSELHRALIGAFDERGTIPQVKWIETSAPDSPPLASALAVDPSRSTPEQALTASAAPTGGEDIGALLAAFERALGEMYTTNVAWNDSEATLEDVDAANAVVAEARARLDAALARLTARAEEAERMLETATVRLGILRDRMEACDTRRREDGDPFCGTHTLSLEEIPAWVAEQSAAIPPRPHGWHFVVCSKCGGAGMRAALTPTETPHA